MVIDVEVPEKLQFLRRPSRYKIAYGGRGGAKSWGFARELLLKGIEKPLRILCAREFQNSIKDSVHKLLDRQITKLGIEALYDVQQTSIKGKNGTEFIFIGLRHNPSGIKSYEDIDIVWVEEAHNVSKTSWDILIPTIRKESSEIWISFNPELEDDETYQRFVIDPPASAVVQKVGYQDNPWFPNVLAEERDALRAKDYDSYLHVWEGNCKQILEGAIYAEQLRKIKEENRVTFVPYDPGHLVSTFWDLGFSDMTSIWFVQFVGLEIRFIDFYQNQFQDLPFYVNVLQERGYNYDIDYLPHDGKNRTILSKKSAEEILRGLKRRVQIVEGVKREDKTSRLVKDGIEAARIIMPRCVFDKNKCADGLQALSHYRYHQDPNTMKWSDYPHHDANSHAADAFRVFAMANIDAHLIEKLEGQNNRGRNVYESTPDSY